VDLLNSVAGWVTLIILVLGVAAGIAVPLVFDLSPWLTAVVLMGLFIVVMLEGSYRVWRETDQQRLAALTARSAELALPATARPAPAPLQPRYRQREPYRQPDGGGIVVEHRVGIRNPAGNPPVANLRLEWTEMSPRPPNQYGYPSVTPPQPVPRLAGGDPALGISLPAGREELWVIASTLTASDGTMSVGAFSEDSVGGRWRGLQWRLNPGDRWRFTYRIVASQQPDIPFSIVMTAVGGQVRCDLELG
jgi:hypothetical protein